MRDCFSLVEIRGGRDEKGGFLPLLLLGTLGFGLVWAFQLSRFGLS